jgi:hypothetical protein
MSLALVTMSHTRLLDHGDPGAEVKAEVEASFRHDSHRLRPDRTVSF